MTTSAKTCFKCDGRLTIDGFYKHPMMADGHLNKCKDCTRIDARENRQRRVEYYRDYDRKRGNRQDKVYRDSYKERFPKKYRAHYALTNAVRDGLVNRMPCQECGREDSHGHHHDYEKPLDVIWLCPVCHAKEHSEEKRMHIPEIVIQNRKLKEF